MISKLKALSLAFGTVLALSAVAATTASATFSFTAPEGPVTATGSQVGEAQIVVGFGSAPLKCNKVEFTATQTAATSTDLTVTPHLKECTYAGLIADFSSNGCSYTFTTPTVKIKTGEYTGEPFHLICPTEKEMKMQTTIGGVTQCTVKLAPQTPTTGHVIYKNFGAGATRDFTIEFAIAGMHYEADKELCGSPVNVTKVDGTMIGGITLKAYKDPTSPINTHTEANHRAITIE